RSFSALLYLCRCLLCDIPLLLPIALLPLYLFFFNDSATSEIYTLSLHDALPILDFQTSRLLVSGKLKKMTSIVSELKRELNQYIRWWTHVQERLSLLQIIFTVRMKQKMNLK